ncbi:Protein daughter of sevenless [Daphnia sinensis]|uniref:Protein daughter of sevenless n=1 Tax=Daphnia sinensis TaxID=1820382 RepID=A0AAD5LFV6_9CRUS|nr:Protein daughter of sevenless [Daphnia sinensis]
MALANTEIVLEGWLVKSPPTKRIWRAKWRRRWFVLKHSGELPGQYFLEYYTDKTCRKLKGKIDLDQCEQVDSGLTIESRKQRYAHMFDIRTPKRVYFLAADSEFDMNSWVGCICHVCGLKVFYRDDEDTSSSLTLTRPGPNTSSTMASTGVHSTMARSLQVSQLLEDTPPTSPTSPTGSSGPYFPLSECLSGSRGLVFQEAMASAGQPSSAPVTPAPTARGLGLGTQSLRGRPQREDWDLFYDQPRQLSAAGQSQLGQSQQLQPVTSLARDDQGVHEAIRSFEDKFARSFKRLQPASAADQRTPVPHLVGGQKFIPPPRPPKPPHLIDQPSHNYLNLEQLQSPTSVAAGGGGRSHSRSSSPRSPPSISPTLPTPTNADAWYDFPRSHQGDHSGDSKTGKETQRRHCYSNAAPGEMSSASGASAVASTADIFTFNNNIVTTGSSCTASAMSPSVYSNLASPFPLASPSPALLPMTPFSPPSVNRTLKPKNQASGAASVVEGPAPPPSVNRQLKPNRPVSGVGQHADFHGSSSDDADDPSSRGSSRPNSAHDEEQIYYFLQGNQVISAGRQLDEIQYLDLDLESDSSLQSPKSPEKGHHHQPHHQASSTVYKTVDFIKTEAFNRTRLTVEERRSKKAQ